MPVHIGTSGWHYEDWGRAFYPDDVAKRRWLEYYSARFQTVESNAAFYRLPKRETFEGWAAGTPDDFVMAVKMSRYLTHIRRLADPGEPVARFMAMAEGLADKLGPVLLQLPPNLHKDAGRLERVLALVPEWLHVAVEFRHPSWFDDETQSILERHGAALCLADRGSRPVSPLWRTADWTYVRFHAGIGSPPPCYGRGAMESWARRLAAGWGPDFHVWAYFNNDTNCCALRDARIFHHACRRVGLRPTRIPAASEVEVIGG